MINFVMHGSGGYRERTVHNIKSTDLTIAFFIDPTTPGEILTKNTCKKEGKLYIPFQIRSTIISVHNIDEVVQKINSHFPLKVPLNINIAGHSIPVLKKHGYDQGIVDFGMHFFLHNLRKEIKINSIITGGQTGIDEAGAKEADKLKIPTTVHAPKGWLFRDINGRDVSNEQLFKQRFNF